MAHQRHPRAWKPDEIALIEETAEWTWADAGLSATYPDTDIPLTSSNATSGDVIRRCRPAW